MLSPSTVQPVVSPPSPSTLAGLPQSARSESARLKKGPGPAARRVIGLAPPAAAGDDFPSFFRTPPYRALHQAGQGSAETQSTSEAVSYTALFAACESLAEAGELVAQGLARKLGAALRMPAGDVDGGKPLHAYGVDSLLAVELGNWFGKEIGAEVAIFDIMAGQSIAELAVAVAGKNQSLLLPAIINLDLLVGLDAYDLLRIPFQQCIGSRFNVNARFYFAVALRLNNHDLADFTRALEMHPRVPKEP
ncbi:MAG: hypothetical protein Q9179_002958 [Wetmoreana sp. 5 TL-2023]